MDDANFSTPIDSLYNDNNDDCNPYDSITPQQSNGACRGREINRTYDPPSPPVHNFQTDARPSVPTQSSGQTQSVQEGFRLPSSVENLRNIPTKEYLFVILLLWLLQKPDFVKMITSYFPVSLKTDNNITNMMVAVVFTLGIFIGREYLVYI